MVYILDMPGARRVNYETYLVLNGSRFVVNRIRIVPRLIGPTNVFDDVGVKLIIRSAFGLVATPGEINGLRDCSYR